MENTYNYSDDWQEYQGYDKFEYDIKLHDGQEFYSCYPNAGVFESIPGGQKVEEKEIAFIRFTHYPKIGINDEVSQIPQDVPDVIIVDEPTALGVFPFMAYHSMVSDNDILSNTFIKRHPKVPRGKVVPVRSEPKIKRNQPCPCGSGIKYKKCCLK